MRASIVQNLIQKGERLIKSFLASVTFYTTIRINPRWQLDFERIARWSPLVGLLIGSLLGGSDLILQQLAMPATTRSSLIVILWIMLTGGLHLDGVMDTADGLAVLDPKRRLEVMQHSVTGAFGVMAGVSVLLLKTVALMDLSWGRGLILIIVAGWGRWGQVAAIAFYPYLKPTGKGAFHKQTIRLPQDLLLGLTVLLGLSGVLILLNPSRWWQWLIVPLVGGTLALLTGFWFYRQLGGHTGDTYGAVVEWTEALFLCILTCIFT